MCFEVCRNVGREIYTSSISLSRGHFQCRSLQGTCVVYCIAVHSIVYLLIHCKIIILPIIYKLHVITNRNRSHVVNMAELTGSVKTSTVQEHLYKILVIGEFGVGKTSIIRRYTEGTFSPNYKLTIGVDFAMKSIEWNDKTKVNLQLWDIAGHERFGHMTRVYYKYAIAAIIVFDLTRMATFDSVLKWLNDVNSKVMLANEEPVPVMLLANKCDMEGVDVDQSKLNNFCKENNILGWFQTSARNNINIDEAMNFLIEHVLTLPTESQQAKEHISLTDGPTEYDDSFETEVDYNKRTQNKQPSCCS